MNAGTNELKTISNRPAEPTNGLIRKLCEPLDASALEAARSYRRPRREAVEASSPDWRDLQLLPAQMHTKPLMEDAAVETKVELSAVTTIGPVIARDPSLSSDAPVQRVAVTRGSSAHRLVASGEGEGVLIRGAHPRAALDELDEDARFVVLDPGESALGALAEYRAWRASATAPRPALLVTDDLQPANYAKALALGARAIVLGLELVAALEERGDDRLGNFIYNAEVLMKVMARACGHDDLAKFGPRELTSWRLVAARAAGVDHAAVPRQVEGAQAGHQSDEKGSRSNG